MTVVVQLLSLSDVPYGCPTQTAPALLLSAKTVLIFVDIRTITMRPPWTTTTSNHRTTLLATSILRIWLTSCDFVCPCLWLSPSDTDTIWAPSQPPWTLWSQPLPCLDLYLPPPPPPSASMIVSTGFFSSSCPPSPASSPWILFQPLRFFYHYYYYYCCCCCCCC